MADQYDILDIVAEAVENAEAGIPVFQGGTGLGEEGEHITIAYLPINALDCVNTDYVNVNIYTKRFPDGAPDIERQKYFCRKVRNAIKNLSAPSGLYFKLKKEWEESLGEAKTGFDCVNIRLRIITEL